MNKLGMHIHSLTSEVYGAVLLLQPRVVTVMDPTPEWVNDIRAVSPNTFIVGRKYEGGQNWQDVSPESWADQCAAMAPCDAWYTWNEPFGHDHTELFTPFDEWQVRFRERILMHGMEAIGLCMSTGNFTQAGPNVAEAFPQTCKTFKYLGPHDYSWPDVLTGAGWYAMRWLRWLEDIGRADIEIIIGEAGITQAVIAGRPDEGWRSDSPENVTQDSYIAALDAYNQKLCEVPQCMGCALFDWGGIPFGWGTFEHIGIENRVFQIWAPETPKPNGGDEMEVEIYDMANQKQNKEWMHTLYGVDWERAVVQPGQKVYRLVLLREKEGPHSLVTQVMDGNGQPMENVDVALYWSDAPDPPDPPTEVYPHDWHRNFTHGPTNVNGDVGPGMGPGAYHGMGECGPHQVWVRAPDIPSDRCYCLGMLAGTNHRHMDQRFKLVVHEEPEPPTDGDLLQEVTRIRVATELILEHLTGQPPPTPGTPFHGEYFNNRTLSGTPVMTRDDEKIDFDWGAGSPAPEIPADNFSVRWTAKKTFEERAYEFKVRVDDGVRLWVDEVLIIDAWKDQGPTTYEATVTLSAGQHDIRMEYYEHGGGAVAQLWWE